MKTWKNTLKVWYFRKFRNFHCCQKWPGLPRQLKTHIAFSMIPILDTYLWFYHTSLKQDGYANRPLLQAACRGPYSLLPSFFLRTVQYSFKKFKLFVCLFVCSRVGSRSGPWGPLSSFYLTIITVFAEFPYGHKLPHCYKRALGV